jgi:hypothetical protein
MTREPLSDNEYAARLVCWAVAIALGIIFGLVLVTVTPKVHTPASSHHTQLTPKTHPDNEPPRPSKVEEERPQQDLSWIDDLVDTFEEMNRRGGFGHIEPDPPKKRRND